MSASAKQAIRPSATLIVVAPIPTNAQQQGECNYRVLMMKRNGKSSFVHAHVFPGGIVDEQDDQARWTLSSSSSFETNLLTHKICAIRETFEESGLLLTNPPAHTVPELDTEIWRHKVHQDASQFKYMCDLYHLSPAVDRLIPFANWITPAFEKKRYNTLFFLTILHQTVDDQQEETIKVSADGKETVLLDWFVPQQGLDRYDQKRIVLFPPQWYSLHSLNQVQRHEDLLETVGIGALRTQGGDPITIRPQAHPSDGLDGYSGFLAYPGDEMYSTAKEDTEKDYVHLPPGKKGDRHRLNFKGKMQDVALECNVDVSKLSKSQL